MKGYITKIFILCMVLFTVGCSSTKFNRRMDTDPHDILRGEKSNTMKARKYLEEVLKNPEGREIKAYKRNIFSADNEQNLFFYHTYYIFFKDGELEHTLVFTSTPRGSERDGNWMLDANADIQTYNLFIYDDNPWDMKELLGPENQSINLIKTTQNIIKRLDENYTFGNLAGMRDLAWYHQIWITIGFIPPIVGYPIVTALNWKSDNCISSVAETIEWNN